MSDNYFVLIRSRALFRVGEKRNSEKSEQSMTASGSALPAFSSPVSNWLIRVKHPSFEICVLCSLTKKSYSSTYVMRLVD
jgi:hypothetical protein